MKRKEREFLNDLKDAVSDWDYSYDTYHSDGSFCVDITIDDMDEWAENEEDIWDALSDVCSEWGAGIDSNMNSYEVAVDFDE